MYPALSKMTLFIEEDGYIYASLPGQDARRLTRDAGEIWNACNGVTSVADLVKNLASKREQPMKEALETVLNFLSHQSAIGFLEIFAEPNFEDVTAHRLDRSLAMRIGTEAS
ncbi:PqqD family protein [Rhizobium ruizarguesonis]